MLTLPPDVWLNASITALTIELHVDHIQARLNVDARIPGVNAQVQLAVELDKIVDIVNRTLQSVDLNPLLARAIKGVKNTTNQLL
ncbi:unnamed protein product [Rotaria sp. Silwood2]|nr:unnamed protein product [Rotaria sp. Silwood2]CAF2690382.1 unnamed protein product [Rotaria sp. Silwood2]CAF3982335.1 unnamed protein product [Rotaria sp. Silwood2]CAF4235676.1 unnamed protein product [Rotaria sp. Silwood2]